MNTILTSEATGIVESYLVRCYTCKGQFDAARAVKCSCITSEQTMLCPHCANCFCSAPDSFKNEFWLNAPASLLKRHKQERQEGFVYTNPDPSKAKRPLVLVVDDDKEIRKIAHRMITAMGYGLLLAENGSEGLTLVRLYRPDVVLADALMPKLDGREMCRQIKAEPELSGIKVAIMTSLYKQVKHKAEAFKEFRVDDYLFKPLDVAQLRKTLQKYCEPSNQ